MSCTPDRTRDWNVNVWSYLYRATGQPSVSHFLTWCLIVELCHTTPGSTEQCGTCRTAGLSLTGCSKSHSIAWIHGLHCMVLHLQTCLDCNTGHTECSTCCVPRLGARNPTNTTTATVKHAEVPNGNYNTDTSRINERNQGKYLIIYLNSQVLNLCLYTVNSAALHRKCVSKSWETSSVKLDNLCYF